MLFDYDMTRERVVHFCFIPVLAYIWYKNLKEFFYTKPTTTCTSESQSFANKSSHFIAIGNIGTHDKNR